MSTVVLGVEQGMEPGVLTAAAQLARDLNARLICVHALSGRYVTEKLADGDLLDAAEPVGEDLAWELSLAITGVSFESYAIAGDPAKVLAVVAEQQDARMIVVGTRRAGLRQKVAELLDGSIALALAQKQHRPVLVVPLRDAG
ncbi:universal stress protein [Glutamicibacter sp. JL.03c]|uniref:universal stress protein n=1 Tax=Glutamicibacter sp. JL.03c TaxID=2984842 RepID=UPI0021F7A939|nr:universal stress protein [Glutamicibacter sp. JL.03c]UYQ76919.1 universal stress protein [Glutamicibacter sp. JL.03c]